MDARQNMNVSVSIRAHSRYLLATDAAAFVLAELLLYAVSRIRVLISPLASILLGAGVLAGFAADVGLWFWKGIRAVDISDDVLTVSRGGSLSPQAIRRADLRSMRIGRLPGGRRVRLRTSSGRCVRIAETAFPPQEFTRFLRALEEWAPK